VADFMAARHVRYRTCLYAWSIWSGQLLAQAIGLLGVESAIRPWVSGGGMSYRWGRRWRRIWHPFEKQLNAKEHAESDVEHAQC